MEPLFEQPTPPEPPKKPDYKLPQPKRVPTVGKTLADGFFGSKPKNGEAKLNPDKEKSSEPQDNKDIFGEKGIRRRDFGRALGKIESSSIHLRKKEREAVAGDMPTKERIKEKHVNKTLDRFRKEKHQAPDTASRSEIEQKMRLLKKFKDQK